MIAMATCSRCAAGMIDEAVLCHPCTDHLAGRLTDIPVVLAELDISLSRQARLTGPVRSSGPSGSIHPQMDLSDAAGGLRAACGGWAHVLDGFTGRAPWHHLWTQLDHVRLQGWAVQFDADIARRISTCWTKIDRPEGRWYAGVCGAEIQHPDGIVECGRILWANLNDIDIHCPTCATRWSVPARREWLIRAAEDFELNSVAVASIVSYVLQRRTSPATVRTWKLRGLLPGPREGEPTSYRVGDVVALAMARDPEGIST